MPGLDALFGGGLALPSSNLLPPEDLKQLRNAALLKTGLAIAGGTGGLFPALSQGLAAGQQAYQGGIENALQAQALQQSMYQNALKTAVETQKLQARQEVLSRYPMPDASDLNRLKSWIDTVIPYFIQNNDIEVLKPLSEIRKAIEETPPANEKITGISGASLQSAFPAMNLDPKKTYTVTVDRKGNYVGKPLEEGVKESDLLKLMMREELTPVQQERIITQIQTRYDQQMKNEIPFQQAWMSMHNIVERAKRGQGAPDDLIGLVDVMSKMYNPGGIVRVGTVKITMDKLGSWKQKINNWIAQGLTGAPDPELVKLIGRAAEAMAAEHARYARHLREQAINRGKRIEVDMDPLLSDPWALGPPAGGIGGEKFVEPQPPLSSFNFGKQQNSAPQPTSRPWWAPRPLPFFKNNGP